jgi:hypothetical protein
MGDIEDGLFGDKDYFQSLNPNPYTQVDPRFAEVMGDIEGGMFGDEDYFQPLVDGVYNMDVGKDWFLVANDFASYLDAQV